ncbi:ABC-type polysaccharide/polyol phosphate export system, permease component [Pedobacter sp. BAL39]|uniref:ABC transporter permease n=1 Tax=Pedobacter sp. BAL39 TaxID=391596 RepID=UPI00015593E8|nr:ABC transporter permease [Pedobacter sp. BAL39]EDM37126.1 ABC-type polysaccharide/polyol phosphate export system, permease component [Pedobacter sp. BAL39]
MPQQIKEQWDIEISPSTRMLDLKLKETWKHRDLLMLLVKRDFISFYKQTILGPLWFFIQPIFTTLIFTFVFGNLAGISTDGLPQPLFYMAGITAWNYFADCLNKTSTVFKDNASIFGKVYFPRLIMPLSIVCSNLIRFGVQMLLFLLIIAYYFISGTPVRLNCYALLLPFNLLLMASLGLGMGMIISAMTTRYRDLAFLVTFGVQLLMYATPVIYPLSVALHKYPDYAWIISYNPMTPIIESFRYGFLGAGSFSWASIGYCTIATITITSTGIIIFNRVEKTFVDTV